jgi:hypothetical protein
MLILLTSMAIKPNLNCADEFVGQLVVFRSATSETEVSNLGLEVLVEQDVGAFDVTVDDLVGVQVEESAGGAEGDVGALAPRQRRGSVLAL